MEAVNCKELTFTYPKTESPVLQGITFTVEKGAFCLVMGKSAAGKSTLLKLLKKEISPAGKMTGALEVNGSVGYVSQNVEESIVCDKVRSELSFGLTNMGYSAEKIELAVAEAASYFNLENKLDNDINALSGGEKQLVNLAAVMIMKPEVLVLDEPCSQLDPVSAERFLQIVKRLNRDFHCTIIISEHSSDEIFSYADSILLLSNGSLLIKDEKHNVIEYIKKNNLDIQEALPVSYRVSVDKLRLGGRKSTPSAPSNAVVTAKNIYFAYDKGTDVLNGLSFQVYGGKINAILGANGSGKSTLLKVLAGVKRHYRGKLKASGSIAMLTQNVFDLFTKERCGDEVAFGEMTDFLEIGDIENQHPYDLSGGQAQRLALAKVLARNADIILLDEPTKGLDALLKIKLAELLQKLCHMGKTVLIVSHDIEFAGTYAEVVSFMSRGRIITTAPRREFFGTLSFYTTALSRLTDGAAISIKDLEDEE